MGSRCALVLGFCLLAMGHAAAEVHEFELDNGLKVFVKENRRAPVVISQVWYPVGSSHEHAGVTGISHILEHMMFKGTEAYGPGEYSRMIQERGGRLNAFTARDYTAYFQRMASEHLETSFKLEADRMANLLLDPEEYESELKVVREERMQRVEDNPRGLTYERLYATAFLNSGYRYPVIGWMSDIENMPLDAVKDWYRRWYAPNKAFVVVVGDADPEEVRELAERHFGDIPEGPAVDTRSDTEVDHRGPRRITVEAQAELPLFLMGYKAPVLTTANEDWEPYALDVLAGILGGGNSARLPRELERTQQVAAGTTAHYNPYARMEDLLIIGGVPAEGRDVAELEDALRAEVERLRETPVSDAELERVKTQVVAENVYRLDSGFRQAMEIGVLESVGVGWEKMEVYVDRIEAVTAEQIQEVARRYLVDSGVTIVELDPQPIDPLAAPSRGTPEEPVHERP